MSTLSCASQRLWDPVNQPQTQQARLARISKVKGLSHNGSFLLRRSDTGFLLHAPHNITPQTRKHPDTIKQVTGQIDGLGFMLANVFHPKQASLSEATNQTGLLRPRIV